MINDPYAEPLVRAVGLEAFTRMLADDPRESDDDPLFNRRQMAEQITVRTRYFDDFFAAAGFSGIRQAVILASGLDTRAYRLRRSEHRDECSDCGWCVACEREKTVTCSRNRA